MGFVQVLFEFCNDLGMFQSHVGLLSQIGFQVVQLRLAVDDDQLPVSRTNRLLVSLFVEFPVQLLLLLRFVFLSEQRRREADAVQTSRDLQVRKLTQRGHDVAVIGHMLCHGCG